MDPVLRAVFVKLCNLQNIDALFVSVFAGYSTKKRIMVKRSATKKRKRETQECLLFLESC